MIDPIVIVKTVEYIMRKKRQMTNRLYGANGGWAAIREIKLDGIAHVYASAYYQITPIVSAGEWDSIIEWCTNTFGPSGTQEKPGVWSMDQRWYVNNARLLFKEEKDCQWFMLRWV